LDKRERVGAPCGAGRVSLIESGKHRDHIFHKNSGDSAASQSGRPWHRIARVPNPQKPFEIIEHPADVGFLAHGGTLEELFENAALAMCSLAAATTSVEAKTQRDVVAAGADVESLLYAWLAEVLAIADAEQLVFKTVRVKSLEKPCGSKRGNVDGAAFGEPFDRSRHAAGTYIKAVTLHQFAVEQTEEGWRARVFLDL